MTYEMNKQIESEELTMKKIKVIILSSIVLLESIIIVLGGIYNYKSDNLNKYVVFNEGLYLNDSVFQKCDLAVNPINLGRKIGITTEDQQVYEIEGMKKEEWICLREDGCERVYRNQEVDDISNISEFEPSQIAVKNYQNIETFVKTDDKKLIEIMLAEMNDENLVNGEYTASTVKDMILYSKKYSGLNYIINYIIDENNEAYIYDPYSENIWKLVHPLFDK